MVVTAEQITRIAVIGAGTMGAGIAQVAAQSGYEVRLYDVEEGIVHAARQKIAYFIHRLAEKGRISTEEAEKAVARLTTTTTLDVLADAYLVIEAAPERLDLKQRIFEELDRITPDSAILATNTSTLSVTQIAPTTDTPERVVGMHFFNPPPLMPLIEVVEGAETAAEVTETAMELSRRLGKKAVRVKDVPGFIVNRVARPFHLEGLRLLEQGVATVETIDRLFREAGGFRMGPFELQDLIGLDINYAASQSVYDAFHHAPRFRPCPLQRQKVESGHMGKKSGRGWCRYEDEAGRSS